MSSWLIVVVGFIYLYVSLSFLVQGKVGLSMAFAGYAFSNIGLYLEAMK